MQGLANLILTDGIECMALHIIKLSHRTITSQHTRLIGCSVLTDEQAAWEAQVAYALTDPVPFINQPAVYLYRAYIGFKNVWGFKLFAGKCWLL